MNDDKAIVGGSRLIFVLGLSGVAGAAESGEAKPGLLSLDVGSIVWVLVIFIVMALLLYSTAWKNVLAGLKPARHASARTSPMPKRPGSRPRQTLREFNQQLATANQKAGELLSKATTDAESLATQIRAHAQQEAEETRERASRDIEAARKQALSDIYRQTAELATSVAEKILRRNLNADDQRDLVESRVIEQLRRTSGRTDDAHAAHRNRNRLRPLAPVELAEQQNQAEPIGGELAATSRHPSEGPGHGAFLCRPGGWKGRTRKRAGPCFARKDFAAAV